jgi:hypothetical protein
MIRTGLVIRAITSRVCQPRTQKKVGARDERCVPVARRVDGEEDGGGHTRALCAGPARTCTCNTVPHTGDRGPKRRTTGIGTWLPLAQTGGGRSKSTGTRCQPHPRAPLPVPGLALHCFTVHAHLVAVGTTRLETWQGNRSAGPNRTGQISLPADDDDDDDDDDERTKTRLHAAGIRLLCPAGWNWNEASVWLDNNSRIVLGLTCLRGVAFICYGVLVVVISCDRVLVFYGGAMKSTPHCESLLCILLLVQEFKLLCPIDKIRNGGRGVWAPKRRVDFLRYGRSTFFSILLIHRFYTL